MPARSLKATIEVYSSFTVFTSLLASTFGLGAAFCQTMPRDEGSCSLPSIGLLKAVLQTLQCRLRAAS